MRREESDLYGLPLDEFVKARTGLERRLRKEGDRERAAAVKKLPKPSVAAWAVNQVSRSQPKDRRDLLEASAELRDTQERLIAGDASAADLDKAARRQRAAIDALADAAAGLLTSEGKGMADATLARVRETLAAIAADEEVAELFETGTLDRERRPAGLGFGFGGLGGEAGEEAPPPKRSPRRTPQKEKPRGAKGQEKEKARGAKERAKADKQRQRELSAARERVKEARAAEREAQKRQRAAERDAEKTAKGLERAERAAEEARERSDEAARAAQEARGQLDAAAAAAEEAASARESAEAELDRLGG